MRQVRGLQVLGLQVWILALAGALVPLAGCGSGSPASGNGGFGSIATGGTTSAQPSVSSVAMSPASVTGGNSAQITVTLAEAAPASGLRVALSSSDPTIANAPQEVIFGAGLTTASTSIPTSVVSLTSAVTISASYGGSRAGTNLSVVPAGTTAPFSVTVLPATLTVLQGKSGTSTVTTKASSGFDEALKLSVAKEPVGVTASLSPATIPAPGSGTSKVTLTVDSSTQTGSYPLTVTASEGSTSESAALTLKVTSGSTNPKATFKGCWYKKSGHRYQGVDVSAANAGTYPFNAVLYHGTTCNPNDFADQFGFGELITFGGFGYTFWFTDFKDQPDMSALWYVGDEKSQCVNYEVAPDC